MQKTFCGISYSGIIKFSSFLQSLRLCVHNLRNLKKTLNKSPHETSRLILSLNFAQKP